MTARTSVRLTDLLFDCSKQKEDVPHYDCTKDKETIAIRYDREIVWKSVIWHVILHTSAIYGAYLFVFSAKWQTNIFCVLLYEMSGLGITAGAHRLWAHRAYKATMPLKIILVIFNTLAFQYSVINWVRDHRMHHKYSDTEADPHNANRGFFFSHIGWLLCRKHPLLKEKGKSIDVSDLCADPILRFQKKYFPILMLTICFVLPTIVPVIVWEDTWRNAVFVATLFRYCFALNSTLLINSLAHRWGTKPYDENIQATENKYVSTLAWGEGYHNYHHAFPWDYKAAELGSYSLNFTTLFLNLCSKIGWAYDLKTVPEEMITSRIMRTGDGSHESSIWNDVNRPMKN